MKAVVFQGIGEIRLADVAEPQIEQSTDAIVRITTSAICGTDLHFVRGTFPGMRPGTIIGHEAVGIVEKLGGDVRNLNEGERVIVPSTIACGVCSYCRHGYYAQCDNANPNGKRAGTAFFGGPEAAGPFQGLQAEKARVPFAHVGLVKIPDEVGDDDAILLSDIFPTAWFGADIASIRPGHTVAVFGCGPVGQLAIASAKLKRAGRIFAIDAIPSRLAMARAQGAEVIDYNADDPVEALVALTGGAGVDRAIDAVGVDANHPSRGPAASKAQQQEQAFRTEVARVAPESHPANGNWHPGDAPSQALRWAVQGLAKAGTLSIIGVYPPSAESFPIGEVMNKNLTLRAGNCNHRRYIPELLELVRSGAVRPSAIITQREPLASAIEAFESFDRREPGWVKIKLDVSPVPAPGPGGAPKAASSVHVAP
jgi:threonine dehydrogenase-like Zn-dependent dehydrogenase